MSLFEENVSNIRFIAWDTETTGLSARTDEIVEIAGLVFDEEFEHRTFESLIRPKNSIPPGVSAIHGINDSMVQSSPDFSEVFANFSDFLRWSGQPRVLVAHNASFDVGMVQGEFSRWTRPLPKNVIEEESFEVCIDSCQLARALLDDLKSHSLASLVEHFKIDQEPTHRALADVKALKQVFLNLLVIASDKYADSRGLTLDRIIALCGGYYQLPTQPLTKSEQKASQLFRYSPALERLAELVGSERSVAIFYDRDEDLRYVTPLGLRTKNSRIYLGSVLSSRPN